VERIGRLYRVERLERAYKEVLSGYDKNTAPEELYHPENLERRLALDDTSLVRGDVSTILTNKDGGKLIALLEGTKAQEITDKILEHFSVERRIAVEEVTLDMASSYNWVVRQCFPNASFVIDRFHVQKLVMEAVQAIRIVERQKILTRRREAKKEGKVLPSEHCYENGDTERELLARSRYLLFKPSASWTARQRERAMILFREVPDLERAYLLSQQLKALYDRSMTREVAAVLLREWTEACESSSIPEMQDAALSVLQHEGWILNFWDNRATNAYAESFNAKLKRFRGMLRGIRDLKFFLFRCQVYFS